MDIADKTKELERRNTDLKSPSLERGRAVLVKIAIAPIFFWPPSF